MEFYFSHKVREIVISYEVSPLPVIYTTCVDATVGANICYNCDAGMMWRNSKDTQKLFEFREDSSELEHILNHY